MRGAVAVATPCEDMNFGDLKLIEYTPARLEKDIYDDAICV
jgi:hypothetical protein